MKENFFQKYYPDSEYLHCSTRADKFVSLISNQKILLELGVGWGANIRNFQHAGWQGKIIGCDLWKRFDQPTDLTTATLVPGDVRDTLSNVLKNIDHIDLLSIDLDGNIDATIFSLDQCKPLLNNSYVYIDELFGFEDFHHGLIKELSTWLAVNVESYDVVFYTDNSVAFKIGGSRSPDHLMMCLLEYASEVM